MAKYVDIDEVKEAIRKAECDANWDECRFDAEFIENAIDFIPAADVAPVVRCKDCKHFNFEHMECENEAVSTDHEGGASYSLNFYLDDFCSYGERKEEIENESNS